MEDNSNELERFRHIIGKDKHDAWMDAQSRNLSIDVVDAIELNKQKRFKRLAYGIPAFAGTIGIVALIMFFSPTPVVDPNTTSVAETEFVEDAIVAEALLADVSTDEAIEMLDTDEPIEHDILTEQDIDQLLQD